MPQASLYFIRGSTDRKEKTIQFLFLEKASQKISDSTSKAKLFCFEGKAFPPLLSQHGNILSPPTVRLSCKIPFPLQSRGEVCPAETRPRDVSWQVAASLANMDGGFGSPEPTNSKVKIGGL